MHYVCRTRFEHERHRVLCTIPLYNSVRSISETCICKWSKSSHNRDPFVRRLHCRALSDTGKTVGTGYLLAFKMKSLNKLLQKVSLSIQQGYVQVTKYLEYIGKFSTCLRTQAGRLFGVWGALLCFSIHKSYKKLIKSTYVVRVPL